MSSRFVSAGGAEVKAPEGLSETSDEAWKQARKQVENARKPHSSTAPAPGTQEGGVSLYEHLQAQKLAKQEAFEEASKLRNQFRPLDEAEVDFLEGIRSRERNAAADIRKETAEQLDTFRRQQAEAEKLATSDASETGTDATNTTEAATEWVTGKKRRRAPDGSEPDKLKSVKSNAKTRLDEKVVESAVDWSDLKPETVPVSKPATSKIDSAPVTASLVAYDSESDS